MRSFITGVVAAIVIAVAAAAVLNAIQQPVDVAFSSGAVRL